MNRGGEWEGSKSDVEEKKRVLKDKMCKLIQLIEQGSFEQDDQASKMDPPLVGIGKTIEKNCEEIVRQLLNTENNVIGVYGMGGVGKTTLMKYVHEQLLTNYDFGGHVYWVHVSKNWCMKKLQKGIAKVVGVRFSGEDHNSKRATILHNKLNTTGPFVLFLDDLWEAFSGKEVGIPLEGSTCKIIFSTRSLEVCFKMGCKSFFNVGFLPKDEAWDMFSEELGHYESLSEETKRIAKCVAEECRGWPLGITTVSRSMRWTVDSREWQNALNTLRKGSNQVEIGDDFLRILWYCYDRLNDQKVQNCFLSCVLFPEDKKISTTSLIDLWINEGLFDEIESREKQVASGYDILDKLENSCLLESMFMRKEKKKYVKMHDMIRDMAIMVTNKYLYLIAKSGQKLNYMPEIERSKDLMKASLSYNYIKELPLGFQLCSPKLTVLMLNHNPLKNISESFFQQMRALRVLNLSYTLIERLPDGISNLENLRALLMEGCDHLSYLPSVKKLTKLRVIRLPYVGKCEEEPWWFERFKCLVKPNCCWKVSDVCSFNVLAKAWQCQLCCFGIWLQIGSEQKEHSDFDPCDGFDDFDNKIVISGVELEEKLKLFLPQTIEMLRIYGCEIKGRSLEDIFPSLSNARELKMLVIENSKLLEYISSIISQQCSSLFSFLECLDVVGLDDLKGLIKLGNYSHGTLYPQSVLYSNLKHLNISGCPKMKVVFPHMVVSQEQPFLPYLKMVTVTDCEQLEEIFETEDDIKSNKPNPILGLTSLRILSLTGLPMLSRVYKGLIICTSMESFTVCYCPKLEILPLSGTLICDSSESTLASLSFADSDWWQPLFQDYPSDVCSLRSRIPHDPVI